MRGISEHTRLLRLAGIAVLAGTLMVSATAQAAFSLAETGGLPREIPATALPEPDGSDDTPPPTPSPTPTPTQTGAVVPTPTPSITPVPTEPAVPVPLETPSASPSPSPTPRPTVTTLPAVPPAITTSTIALPTLLIALGVVIAGGLVVWSLIRRRPASSPAIHGPVVGPDAVPTGVVLDSMAALGSAMIDSGYPVGLVRNALEDMAEESGKATAQAIVFPTSILVSAADSETTQTRAVGAGDSSYLLYQVDFVDRIVGVARTRPGAAAWVKRQISRVAEQPAPFSRSQRILGYGLLSGALSVLLEASWLGVLVGGLLGLAVGAALLVTERLGPSSQALVIVGISLSVSLVVLIVAHTLDPRVLPAIIAPLVILLPGGLLTISVIELATGHIMSGAARAAAGAMRLMLLATGIVAASALLGVPAIGKVGIDPLGPVAPWIAVAVFGVGITVYQCARPRSIAWIILVLYVAYGAQVLGDILFDGVLSALVGAAVMTPVAVVVARQRTGPPALVSFLPAFWLLVPGALGLIGVASVLEGDLNGTSTIVTTIATMIAIALGVLLGLAVTGSLHGFVNSEFDRPDGPDSPDGTDGTDGANGADGPNGADGSDNSPGVDASGGVGTPQSA